MFEEIPGNVRRDSRECSKRFRGMFKKIPGNADEDSGGFLRKFPENAEEDSEECWQRFSKILKKIKRFMMQLKENRIKVYMLKYNKKCEQKFIKTSHVNEHVSV